MRQGQEQEAVGSRQIRDSEFYLPYGKAIAPAAAHSLPPAPAPALCFFNFPFIQNLILSPALDIFFANIRTFVIIKGEAKCLCRCLYA